MSDTSDAVKIEDHDDMLFFLTLGNYVVDVHNALIYARAALVVARESNRLDIIKRISGLQHFALECARSRQIDLKLIELIYDASADLNPEKVHAQIKEMGLPMIATGDIVSR